MCLVYVGRRPVPASGKYSVNRCGTAGHSRIAFWGNARGCTAACRRELARAAARGSRAAPAGALLPQNAWQGGRARAAAEKRTAGGAGASGRERWARRRGSEKRTRSAGTEAHPRTPAGDVRRSRLYRGVSTAAGVRGGTAADHRAVTAIPKGLGISATVLIETSICCTGPRTGCWRICARMGWILPKHRHRRYASSGAVVRACADRAQPRHRADGPADDPRTSPINPFGAAQSRPGAWWLTDRTNGSLVLSAGYTCGATSSP